MTCFALPGIYTWSSPRSSDRSLDTLGQRRAIRSHVRHNLNMTATTIEASSRGKWQRVLALHVDGADKDIVVKGKWLKTAVIFDEIWLDTDLEDPESCLKLLRNSGRAELRADIFTFTQQLPATDPKFAYHTEWDSLAAIEIPSFNDWWEKLPQESRKNVRRSQKRGVVTSVRPLDDDLIRGIMGVNNDDPVRQGVPYAHYGKTFEQVQKDQSSFPGRSEFICAHLEDELIGFVKLVYRGASASILQFLPKTSHADKRPGNALMAEAVKQCAAKGVSWLTYGLFNYGKKQDSPLREFKIRNGFREVLMPRYYVALTTWGKLCMAAGAHRGLVGMLPSGVIPHLVRARAKYYQFKQSPSRCSSMAEQPKSNRQMGCSSPPAGSNQSLEG